MVAADALIVLRQTLQLVPVNATVNNLHLTDIETYLRCQIIS